MIGAKRLLHVLCESEGGGSVYRARGAVSQGEFCWASSPGGQEREEADTSGTSYERADVQIRGGNARCGTLRESPDKNFVLSQIPQLNYSYVAIIVRPLSDSWWNVGVTTLLWSLEMLPVGSCIKVNKNSGGLSGGWWRSLLWLQVTPHSHRLIIFILDRSFLKQPDNKKRQPLFLIASCCLPSVFYLLLVKHLVNAFWKVLRK